MSTFVAGPPVPSPRWPVPEERRTVTVLFVDIVGSTALVDRLDPEDVRALQRAYFDTVGRVLRRWHGVVEKYVGDAVMALFGARESDGYDAYRAVRAGLEIQEALDGRPLVDGTTVRVRVGVATGEAVVDLAAARAGGHGVASGAVITTAARLQGYAAPGAVALCAATHRATAGLVTQRQLTPVTVPNRVPPMDVWHAVGVVTPPRPRHDGPLVGHRRELAGARDQIVRAVRERSPRWVALVGPSGSGRSRLLHELTHTVDTVDGVPVRWCVTACPPYPEQPLGPVADLLRGLTGGRPGEPAARDRLAALLAGLLPPSRLTAALSALERLLASPDGGDDAADGAGWCQEVLLRLAARGPVVVAVDDLDRAAPAVDRFLHRLFTAAAARDLPLAVVALHTPDRAGALVAPHRHGVVTVRPLAPVQTGRLLRHLLTRAGRPVSLVDRLLPLVGDRPGHAVAYVRSLVDGTDPRTVPLPEPLHRTVAAELDRLPGAGRAVVMAAATLDARFTPTAVARLLDSTPDEVLPLLRSLFDAGLLVAHTAGTYAIATPALRRVAAGRLPRRTRAVFAARGAAVEPAERTAPRRPGGVRCAPPRVTEPAHGASPPPAVVDRGEPGSAPATATGRHLTVVAPRRPAIPAPERAPHPPGRSRPAVRLPAAVRGAPTTVPEAGSAPRERDGRTTPSSGSAQRDGLATAPVGALLTAAAGPAWTARSSVPPVRRRAPGAARDGHPVPPPAWRPATTRTAPDGVVAALSAAAA
ncbi:adenylate/guanylate cyclase domain-containing protein [Micromonospora krabiensis]|uniref:Adenylate cyclase, class 3 n=1 Tax=Micromonospora krabiensis TaxID=307121 RepID=A0A1C3MZR7_9ACTN|nr:adenylate/guanylate cyclase domain-containing protein [Micromonospora krabiensis]SBV25837.1 Adenylate cyclase, class 3 [Micromonospora krabiensis]